MVKFHPKLSSLFSDLGPKEYALVKRVVEAKGHAMIETWRGFLADGHHSYQAAKEMELDVEEAILDPDWKLDEVIEYLKDKHHGRRHMTSKDRDKYILHRVKALTDNFTPQTGGEHDLKMRQTPPPKLGDVYSDAAEEHGVSRATAARAVKKEKEIQTLIPELQTALDKASGKVTAKQAQTLAKMPPDGQKKVSEALEKGKEIKDAIDVIPAPPKPMVTWVDEWSMKCKGLLKSIDKIVGTIDDFRATNHVTPAQKRITTQLLKELDVAHITLDKLKDSIK